MGVVSFFAFAPSRPSSLSSPSSPSSPSSSASTSSARVSARRRRCVGVDGRGRRLPAFRAGRNAASAAGGAWLAGHRHDVWRCGAGVGDQAAAADAASMGEGTLVRVTKEVCVYHAPGGAARKGEPLNLKVRAHHHARRVSCTKQILRSA